MKPIIKYRGGKSREIPHIMCHVPRFTGRYVEPFFGGGALFFYLEPRQSLINDINTKLMTFYAGVRNNFEPLSAEIDKIAEIYKNNRQAFETSKSKNESAHVTDANEALYYKIRDMFNGLAPKEYSDALIYFFINKTAYSGMIRYNAQGHFNVPYGRYPNFSATSLTRAHSLLLQKAEILNADYSEVFNRCENDDFVFLDPPYDCVFSDYGNEEFKDGFNEQNHRKLAADFVNLPCKTLMVIGKTPLTESLYKKYIIDEYGKNYAVNIRNRFKATAQHIVVANFRKCWDAESHASQLYHTRLSAETSQLRLFEATEPYGNPQI